MRSSFKQKVVALKSGVASCLTYLLASSTLQCQQNAFQQETYLELVPACFTWLAAFISYVTKGSQNSTLIGLPCFAWAVRANDLIYMTKGRQSTEDPRTLFSICLRTFHTRLSRFPTLEGDISQRRYTWSWGPISFLEFPHLVLGFDLLLQAKLHVPGNLPAGKTNFSSS